MNDLKEKNTVTDDIQKTMTDTKRRQQMKAYDAKLEQLAETIEKTAEKHGQDYFMVEILTMFLDVSIKMKEVMEMLNSMNTVMELFGDAVSFIDQSLQLQSDILSDTTAVKYNVWTRITAHFRNKRIIRNNVNRLTSISSNILIKYKMANDMSNSLQKVSTKLKGISKKMTPKKKAGSKKSAAPDQYSDASKYLADRKIARGEAPAASSASSSSSGLDVSGI
jgi:hypothetical protein